MEQSITTTNNKLMDEAQRVILTQNTPRNEIRTRQGRGGRYLPYVDHAYVTRLLNNAFAFNWDFETDEAEVLYVGERPFEVKCRGRLTVRAGEQTIVKMQYGCQPIELLKDGTAPVSLGDAFKGAASDALKKCASLLGIALDLYDSDSETVTGRPAPTQAPPKNIVVEQKQASAAPSTPVAPKPANGKKVASDPMTQFWAAVREANLSNPEGQRILSSVGGDAVKAIDALQGISQPTAN